MVSESSWSSSAPTTLSRGSARGSRCEAHATSGRAASRCLRCRQGLAGCGAAVRTQHRRDARVGGRGGCSRSRGSPPRSAAALVDLHRARGDDPAGRPPVPRRNARVRQLLHRCAPARVPCTALALQSAASSGRLAPPGSDLRRKAADGSTVRVDPARFRQLTPARKTRADASFAGLFVSWAVKDSNLRPWD